MPVRRAFPCPFASYTGQLTKRCVPLPVVSLICDGLTYRFSRNGTVTPYHATYPRHG